MYDLDAGEAASLAGCDAEQIAAVVGHLARAGVVQPAPASIDRMRGRLTGPCDGRALAACRTSAADAERARWRQYRAVWEFVERRRLPAHRDPAPLRRPLAALAARALLRRVRSRPGTGDHGCRERTRPGKAGTPVDAPALDDAIVEVVDRASPAVGRTRAVEILRGGRSRVIREHSYDGLPLYGTFSHLAGGRSCSGWTSCWPRGACAPPAGASPSSSGMNDPRRVAVLASGAGTNLQAILDTVHGGDGIEVVAVASNRQDAKALERARAVGIEHAVFETAPDRDRAARDAAMAAWLAQRDVGLVVLAGYMELLEPEFLSRFPNAVINVHPALLPAFPGLHAIEQALAYGVKVFGVTVHLVDEGVDSGPILLQRAIELPHASQPADVLEALRPLEHELLPEAVRLMARGAVTIDPAHPRRVLIAR